MRGKKGKTMKIALAGVAIAAAGAIGYYIYKKRSAAAVSGLGALLAGGGGHHGGGHHGGHHGGGYGGGWGGGWGGYPYYQQPVVIRTIDPCAGTPCPVGYYADYRRNCRCTRAVL